MPCIETLPFLLKSLRLPAIAHQWQERIYPFNLKVLVLSSENYH